MIKLKDVVPVEQLLEVDNMDKEFLTEWRKSYRAMIVYANDQIKKEIRFIRSE